MIDSISPVSVQRSNASSFKGELPYSKTQSQEKQGMSTAQKTLLGLGALATLTVGGLLVKKHFDIKKLQNFLKEIPVPDPKLNITQIEELNRESYIKIIRSYMDKLGTHDFDAISAMSKSNLRKLFTRIKAPKEYFSALENMSEKGFMIIGKKGKDYAKVLGYVDPKNNNIPKIEEAFKDGKIYSQLVAK